MNELISNLFVSVNPSFDTTLCTLNEGDCYDLTMYLVPVSLTVYLFNLFALRNKLYSFCAHIAALTNL